MKRVLTAMLLLALAPIYLSANILWVVNSQSRTLSRIDLATDTVNNSFAQLGNVPNKVLTTPEYLYVVNSADNSLQKISVATGATIANHFIAVGSNPWDAILHDGYIYVSGLFTGKVYKLDINTGQVIGSVNVGSSPEAMAVQDGKLYVCNAGNYAQNYAGSSVSVVDLASFSTIKSIPMPVNPQYIVSHDGLLHVSCTGNWTDLAGAIGIIDPATDALILTIPLGASPGNIWINSLGIAYVADGGGNNLYSYNAIDYSLLHPADAPLPFAASDLTGNSNMLALLNPNWGNNALVQLLHPDLALWKSFSVGMMPSDIKLQIESSANGDASLLIPPAQISVYPSPLHADAAINLKSLNLAGGEFQLYNLKGQRVYSTELQGGEHKSVQLKLPSAAYIYRYQSLQGHSSGKLIILH